MQICYTKGTPRTHLNIYVVKKNVESAFCFTVVKIESAMRERFGLHLSCYCHNIILSTNQRSALAKCQHRYQIVIHLRIEEKVPLNM